MFKMSNDQQTIWQTALDNTRAITDGLGMPIDEEIVETVAIMRLMGINTTMSCGGHLDRVTGGPYIMFSPREAKQWQEECRGIEDKMSPAYKHAYDMARKASLAEQSKLMKLLEEYYSNHQALYPQMLVAHNYVFGNRLYCQGVELANIASPAEQKQILADNLKEMKDFTEFLKVRYFNTKLEAPTPVEG